MHEQLLQWQRKRFLHHIVTSDEKWIHYDNPKNRRSWGKPGHTSTSVAKPNIHGLKLLLCTWSDLLGVVYYEMLKPTKTITGDCYQLQLMCLSQALKKKWLLSEQRHDKVILQHDNARSHCKMGKNLLGNAWMGNPTLATTLPRHCPVQLLLVPINGIWPGRAAFSFLGKSPKNELTHG